MTPAPDQHSPLGPAGAFGDLVEEIDRSRGGRRPRAPRRPLGERLSAWRDRQHERFLGTPERRARTVRRARVAGPLAAIALGVGLYLALRPMPQPDYAKDNMKRVLTYTLLRDEFNRLPLDKRLELVGQLSRRFQSMSAGDSTLMAAFAAGIAGGARRQLEQNASKLMIDLWDRYAVDYNAVKPEDRERFIDSMMVELSKLGETMSGQPRELTDEERVAESRRQAQRDQRAMARGQGPGSAQGAGRVVHFLTQNVAVNASPAQRARGALLMRDVAARMRGEPIPGSR